MILDPVVRFVLHKIHVRFVVGRFAVRVPTDTPSMKNSTEVLAALN